MPPPDPAPAPPAEAVAPLIRGVAVLQRLTEANGALSPSALERATGLARSTVDRIVATLVRMGYVRLDGRDATLTPRVMELGNAYLAALRLPDLLSARADALADALDESVSLAVPDRDGIRFVHQATRRRAMSLSFRMGDLLPAERTAPGPLFATEWTADAWRTWRTRRQQDPHDRRFPAVPPVLRPPAGPTAYEDFERRTRDAAAAHYALDDQLIEPGLVAVSVPVRDPRTARIACVASVVSHTSRHTAAGLRDTLLPRLRTAVATMEEDLRQAPPPAPGAPRSGTALWTGASKQELGREFVESLARGLTVLTAFGEGRAELTLTDVAKATGLARATARRALITYEHLGLLTPADAPTDTAPDAGPAHRAFALTPRVLSLGFPPLSRTSLPRIATPHLRALTDAIQETTALAVLTESGDEIQYTARVPASHVMSVDIRPGTRLPAAATAAGRLLGQGSPTTPTPTAYTVTDEELEQGVRSIAVPIRDRTGRAIAALNAAAHVARRTTAQCVDDILPALRATASHIETDLHTASRFTHVPLT